MAAGVSTVLVMDNVPLAQVESNALPDQKLTSLIQCIRRHRTLDCAKSPRQLGLLQAIFIIMISSLLLANNDYQQNTDSILARTVNQTTGSKKSKNWCRMPWWPSTIESRKRSIHEHKKHFTTWNHKRFFSRFPDVLLHQCNSEHESVKLLNLIKFMIN